MCKASLRRTMGAVALPAMLGLVASPVLADMQVQLFNSFYGSMAGEFDVDSVGTTPVPFITDVTHSGHDFITFCVEIHGPVTFGTTYDVVLNHASVDHVIGGAPDPLDPRTAYLFSRFAQGQLSNYETSGWGRRNSADELQETIWYIEEEWDTLDGQAATWLAEAEAAVGVGGVWYNQWGADSIGNVRILNLYEMGHAGDSNFNIQDQLVMVPAPSAILLGAIGLGIAGFIKRRLV